MALEQYRRKRDFRRTREPMGEEPALAGSLRFVVQQHAATRLHYDFRLELGGVLKSWSIPKGPSLDPAQKRLAVEVEDHPLEYGDFEGLIPQGEYGAGTVLLWDRGSWTPEGDAEAGFRQGKLKFQLAGKKLRGRWTLVRMRGQFGRDDGKNWLLIKERDNEAKAGTDGDILEAKPLSVASGRSLEQIARAAERTWHSRPKGPDRARLQLPDPTTLPGARRAALPKRLEPQVPSRGEKAPEGSQWLHEIKLEGLRVFCRIEGGRVSLWTGDGQDWSRRFGPLKAAAESLPVREALLDGQVVVAEPGGRTSFRALYRAMTEGDGRDLAFHAFDLLHLEGYDLCGVPLEKRKSALAALLKAGWFHAGSHVAEKRGHTAAALHYVDHLEGQGPMVYRQACRLGLAGIVSKRRDGAYRRRSGGEWLETPCLAQQPLVIGGFTKASTSRTGLAGLLVGYHGKKGELVYAGAVGTGFSEEVAKHLRQKLEPLRQPASPFADSLVLPGKDESAAKRPIANAVQWVKPEVVAQVELLGWTPGGLLRHASFQGLREDRPAGDVARARPPRAKAKSKSKSAGLAQDDQRQLENLRLTHPDRLLYPADGVTKLGLASYYLEIADWILPHVAGRPITLFRCPEGHQKHGFYQRHVRPGTPAAIRRLPIEDDGKTETCLYIEDLAGLVAMVQLGVLEIHPWGCRADDVERPDRLVFDLDPDPALAWSVLVEGAVQVRQLLADLGLESFVKTTGGKGLHVVVPIQRRQEWAEAREFCRAVAQACAAQAPKRFTTNSAKDARRGTIYLDFLRNRRGATSVAAYSSRALPGAPVSVPLEWEELDLVMRSNHFTVDNALRRLSSLRRDPWKGMLASRQSITAAAKRKLHSFGQTATR